MRRKEILPEWLYEFDIPEPILNRTLARVRELDFSQGIHGRQVVLRNHPEFEFLSEYFDECLEQVRVDLGMICPKLKSGLFWVNRSTFGQWHPVHKHGNSFASGIMYLTPSGSQTWFSKECLWSETGNLSLFPNEEEMRLEISKYNTSPGTLVIFPSRMLHSVNEHDLQEPRYTLSFNSYPRGTIGSEEGLTCLDL